VTDANGRHRSLLPPTITSPQFERHSAPSRISRSHLPPPPPSEAIQPPTANVTVGRTSTGGAGIPSVAPPVSSGRPSAESSSKLASCTELGLARRTFRARPAVDSSPARRQQDPSPVRARYPAAAVVNLPEDELQEDGFMERDLADSVNDSGYR